MILPQSLHDVEYLEKVKEAMAMLEKAAKIMDREDVEDVKQFSDAWDSRNQPEPDLKRLLREYIEAMEASQTTKRIYTGRTKAILGILGDMFIKDIELKHLEAIDTFFKDQKKTRASAKLCHALLSGMLKWAARKGNKSKMPYSLFKCSIKKLEEKRFFIVKEAVEALFVAYSQEPDGNRKKAMQLYLIQCYTGARYSDACKMTLADFEKGHYISQKTGRKSQVYLSNRLQLLCPQEKIGMRYNAYRRHLVDISQAIGHDYTKTHAARRYFATEIFEKSDYNLKVVQHALGHSSMTTTEKYIGLDSSALQSAVMSLGE